jgi:hypothetical protein
MTGATLTIARSVRRWGAALSVIGLLALSGCKTDKEMRGTGVARGKQDPLVYGPNLIPKQNVPVPDRATGPRDKGDPLTTPTGGSGGKVGYNDDLERFQGTHIPGKATTPAALAGRFKDGDELKIVDGGGVILKPLGGTSSDSVEPPEDVEPLLLELEKRGVSREYRSFERADGKWTFRASLQINSNGARRQYAGVGTTAREATKQVLDQIKNEK